MTVYNCEPPMECQFLSLETPVHGRCYEYTESYCNKCTMPICEMHQLTLTVENHFAEMVKHVFCSTCATAMGHTVYECDTCGRLHSSGHGCHHSANSFDLEAA